MKLIKYTKPRKVKVGDEILGYGTVTALNEDGTFQTDTGYTGLRFPKVDPTADNRGKFTVPVVSRRFLIRG